MIIAIIPAKEKSNRLKNKNLIKINGETLLEHAIKYVKKSKVLNFFLVTTESKKIQRYLKKKKIPYVNRPKNLCGETPLLDVYKHAYEKIKFKKKVQVIAGIQCDHPDRKYDLDEIIRLFKKKKLDFLFSKDKFNVKNGAHYIFKKKFFSKKGKIKKSFVIDNCTNIHYKKDLLKAKKNLYKYEN